MGEFDYDDQAQRALDAGSPLYMPLNANDFEVEKDGIILHVKKRFYHSYFGGRGAWVNGGRFGCTIHTD